MRNITLPSMRRARWLLALPLCLATLLLTTNKAAAAPFAVSGTYALTSNPEPTDYHTHGCGCVGFYTQLTTSTLSGTMTGTGSYEASCQIRWRSGGDGVCQGTFVFDGTIANRTGTATFHIVTHFDATQAVHGTMSVVSGTGGLADLHGQLDIDNDTYSGQLVFST
jgi:hypothetical protein